MIFFELFYTFLIIGAFTFGGGYSMVALIQDWVVDRHHWITAAEFTDLLAVSQLTPGPIGINTATYAGYTAVLNAGYSVPAALAGSLLASFSVVLIPVALIFLVGRLIHSHRVSASGLRPVMHLLRLVVVGLIAAAALQLMPTAFSATPGAMQISILDSHYSVLSLIIFLLVLLFSILRPKSSTLRPLFSALRSPIFLILASAVVGLIVYTTP